MAPPRLASQLHSLPPILHKLSPNPMPSCSKAPRGLFVPLRVTRIFTRTSISPGPSLRQCSSHYAIRAGRNLTFQHWAGVSPYTSSFDLAETCVFVKQLEEPFLCGPQQLCIIANRQGPSFSRSYGCILPNSLTRVLPIPLVSSTHLPVSVCGTVTQISTLRSFSRRHGSITCGSKAPPSRFGLGKRICLLPSTSYAFGTSIR